MSVKRTHVDLVHGVNAAVATVSSPAKRIRSNAAKATSSLSVPPEDSSDVLDGETKLQPSATMVPIWKVGDQVEILWRGKPHDGSVSKHSACCTVLFRQAKLVLVSGAKILKKASVSCQASYDAWKRTVCWLPIYRLMTSILRSGASRKSYRFVHYDPSLLATVSIEQIIFVLS